jgi:hypothetical protein
MTSPLPVLPQIIVEAGLVSDNPSQPSTALKLNDATLGKLDTGTLGTGITWSEISPWVLGFTITRPSTRLAGPLWNYQPGTISVVLDNSDGRFDPDNLAGPYVLSGVTQLAAMVPVRVRCNFGSGAYPLYSGFADGWLPAAVTYEGGYAELTVSGTDAFKVLAGITLPAVSLTGVGADTGTRVRDILSRAGWYTSAERNVIDTGNSTLQGTTLGDTALNLMQLAVDSEIGQLYVNGAGAVVFRARRSLLTDTRSNTVQAVFGDLPGFVLWQVQWTGDGVTAGPGANSQAIGGITPGASYQASALFWSAQGWSQVQLNINWFTAGGGYLSTGAGPVAAAPAGTAVLATTGPQTAPASAAQYTITPGMGGTPASSVVMAAAWNHGAASPELTSAPGAWTWTPNNSATVTNLGTVPASWYPAELPYAAVTRASDDTTIVNDVQATRAGSSSLQEVKDTASIAKYLFPRTYPRSDLLLQGDPDALSWAQWVLSVGRSGEDRFESLAVDPQADPVNLWPQVLGREIGDRIQVWHRPASVAAPIAKDCFIAGITHAWDSVNSAWLTTWVLQDASKYGSFMTLDNTTLGKLDSNALSF